ncbi:MAG: RNA polymerase sigma factor [Reichenbachiella sp.]|uniref:RNA polymerase sigma factor n=1 Tax=Reichenbachiella sp. TaxID=2184521 RepID=UPI00296770F2|nr:RNA polymerase sigma factor [Reichenbachiella sp.]MDW3212314.1 RNA polymerase sigma factor [Reichenbachiella sp.]
MDSIKQEEIFQDWLARYKALFFKFVRAYAFKKTDQDDLFQEICIQVWKSIPNFRNDSAVSTWLYRVTMNTALSWVRKGKKHANSKPIDGYEPVVTTYQSDDDRLEWLYEQIAQLNKVDRALCLLMLDGFNYKEMSAMLGISSNNVGVKINRIKKKLIEKSKKLVNDEL